MISNFGCKIKILSRGDHGRLGHGDTASLPYPKLVAALRGVSVVTISSGGGHNAALTGTLLFYFFWGFFLFPSSLNFYICVFTASGEVYCWGRYVIATIIKIELKFKI